MKRWMKRALLRRRSSRARGAAVVEFAVVLPLLLTILFGIIEYGYVFMVRQSLQHAAREGCRLASLSTSDSPYTNVITRVDQCMAGTGLTSYTTTVTTGVCEETVTVTIPYDDVSLIGFFDTPNYDLTGSCSMRKEGCTVPGS
ncbi:MAG: pilus assembly protein [Phycisphaerales bacterium]|nr:MAG: pilus assembly protein [Phycisphaerales bacterium]